MAVLSTTEAEELFKQLPLEWTLEGGVRLQLSVKFDNFQKALDYVNKIGKIAESRNHHPDIKLSYGSVDVEITTHSAAGLTEKDFDLAKAIGKI
jgi:4a-hydroxytetrahydrobiopterin dehydratase